MTAILGWQIRNLTLGSAADAAAPFAQTRWNVGEVAFRIIGSQARTGPADMDETSLAAKLRWRRVDRYRPKPLNHLRDDLNAWQEPGTLDLKSAFNP